MQARQVLPVLDPKTEYLLEDRRPRSSQHPQTRGIEFRGYRITALVAEPRPLYANLTVHDDAPVCNTTFDRMKNNLDERSRGRIFSRWDETRVMKFALDESISSAREFAEESPPLLVRERRARRLEYKALGMP